MSDAINGSIGRRQERNSRAQITALRQFLLQMLSDEAVAPW